MMLSTGAVDFSTDFETGLAMSAEEVSETEFSVLVDLHFTVSVTNPGSRERTAVLVFRERASVSGGRIFRSVHTAARLWMHMWGRPWDQWHEIPRERVTWTVGTPEGETDSVRVEMPLAPGESVVVSSNTTWPYSACSRWLRTTARRDRRVRVSEIGRSAGGRPILLASITAPGDTSHRERFLVAAGVHGNEYQGQFATRGMIEWLLSGDTAAQRLLGGTVFDVVLQASPDGAVANRYHNDDDMDIHHYCGPAYEAISRGESVAELAPEAVGLVRHILEAGNFPSRYFEPHSAWQAHAANRANPLPIGVVPASSRLARMIWHERTPFGRTDGGPAAGGYVRHRMRSAAPLENNYRYTYGEEGVTLYDLLPNRLDVPSWVVEFLPGCGVSGNREHGGGHLTLGAESLRAFAEAAATLRRGSDYLVGGLPLLSGGLLADMEAKTKAGGAVRSRSVVGDVSCALLSARKKVFDRRAVLGDSRPESRPFLVIEARTTYVDLDHPLCHVRFAPSGWDIVGAEFATVIAAAGELEMAPPRVERGRSRSVRWTLWCPKGSRRGLGVITVPCGEGSGELVTRPRVLRKGTRPVEIAACRGTIGEKSDAVRGRLNQAVVLVPDATATDIARAARRVENPCTLEARAGAVLSSDEWNYCAACGRGGAALEIRNPLASSRDAVMEIRDLPPGSRVRCSGAGGSDVQLVPGPDPAGPQTAVVYLHAIRPRGSARVTVRPG